ncbi:unnamed protein product [Sphagnum balticum]
MEEEKFMEPDTAVKPEREEKELGVATKTEIAPSFRSIPYKSLELLMELCPLRSLMEKSHIMDGNTELYLRMRENNRFHHEEEDEQDNISIEDEMER